MATGLLKAGWPVPLLREVIMRPLPDPIEKPVGAVISGSLRAATAVPVPGSAAGAAVVPHQVPGPDRAAPGEGRRWGDAPTPAPPAWADLEQQHNQLRRGIDLTPGSEADDGLCPTLAVVGEARCALHLGWPLRPGLDGCTCTVRTRTGDPCATCQDQARYAGLDAALPVAETDDGTAPATMAPAAAPPSPATRSAHAAASPPRATATASYASGRPSATPP